MWMPITERCCLCDDASGHKLDPSAKRPYVCDKCRERGLRTCASCGDQEIAVSPLGSEWFCRRCYIDAGVSNGLPKPANLTRLRTVDIVLVLGTVVGSCVIAWNTHWTVGVACLIAFLVGYAEKSLEDQIHRLVKDKRDRQRFG